MKRKIHSISIVINSNSETLFKVVSDFENYNSWNRIITNAKGQLEEGELLQLKMKIDGKIIAFNPKVISIDRNKSFLLSKVFLSKRLGEIMHLFEFKEVDNDRTEFVQTWTGKGVLIKIMWPKLKKGFSDFKIFNEDLEKFIEKLNPHS